MNRNQLALDYGTVQFIVDSYMGVYFIPYEEADDSYQWHVSELNHSHYERLYRELTEYVKEIGFTEAPFSYKEFLNICERLFEMYRILRKLP